MFQDTLLLAFTPKDSKEVVKYRENLQKSIVKYDIVDLDYIIHIERFVKKAITDAHSHDITERDLFSLHKQEVAKVSRKKYDSRVV